MKRKTKPVNPTPTPAPAPVPAAPEIYDYVKASGLTMDPDVAEYLNRLMAADPVEVVYQLERESRKEADRQFECLRAEVLAEEAERVRLWGKKYPPEKGQKPEDFEPRTGGIGRPKKVCKLRPIPYPGSGARKGAGTG